MCARQTNEFGRNEQFAAIIGSLAGAVPGGLFIFGLGGMESMRYFAWLVGSESPAVAWGVWLAMTLAFGTVFGVWMARSINSFTNTIIMISRESDLTQKLLVPILRRSALGLTAWGMGLLYGNVLAFGLFAYLVPGIVWVNGFEPPMYPLADVYAIVGILLYASVLGATYGILLEQQWFSPAEWVDLPGVTPPGEPTGYLGFAAAGLVSGLFALVGNGGWMFQAFAWLAGLTGTSTGLIIWVTACTLLGVPFAAVVSRSLDRLAAPLADTPLDRVSKTVTSTALGLGYGTLLGGLFVAVTATTSVFWYVGMPGLSTAIVYGLVLGLYTGFLRESYGVELSLGDRDVLPADDREEDQVPATERGGFPAWRARRPFAGGMLLVLSGFIIAAIPIRIQQLGIGSGTSPTSLGIVFGAMIVACGLFALVSPDLSTLIGVTGIAMSILSLYGAFGGLIIGMLVGIVGGNLCIAWQDPTADEDEDAASEGRFEWLGGERQQWRS